MPIDSLWVNKWLVFYELHKWQLKAAVRVFEVDCRRCWSVRSTFGFDWQPEWAFGLWMTEVRRGTQCLLVSVVDSKRLNSNAKCDVWLHASLWVTRSALCFEWRREKCFSRSTAHSDRQSYGRSIRQGTISTRKGVLNILDFLRLKRKTSTAVFEPSADGANWSHHLSGDIDQYSSASLE